MHIRFIAAIFVAFILAGCQQQPAEQPNGEAAESAPPDTEQVSTVAKININTATKEQMLAIPDVGDRMAREFDEYRPYSSITQFRREIGKYVDDDQVAAYEEYIFVPIDPNDADAATLMQIPGITEDIAQAIADARPFNSSTDFLVMLGNYIPVETSGIASSYISHGD